MNHITTKSLTYGFTTQACGNEKLLLMPLSLSVIFLKKKKKEKQKKKKK